MRVTLDSNAWEAIFDESRADLASVRAAFGDGRLAGFICATGFRLEAIRRKDRPAYFQQPYMSSESKGVVMHHGRPALHISFGPDDSQHPGLPQQQKRKFEHALAAGVKLIRGGGWMGLPCPPEILDPALYPEESPDGIRDRQQREIDAFHAIELRGAGKAAFEAADGWVPRERTPAEARQLSAACAEWADAETVSSHIAYQNDVLCTEDRGRNAGVSVFDESNRAWLATTYLVRFMTLAELTQAAGCES